MKSGPRMKDLEAETGWKGRDWFGPVCNPLIKRVRIESGQPIHISDLFTKS